MRTRSVADVVWEAPGLHGYVCPHLLVDDRVIGRLFCVFAVFLAERERMFTQFHCENKLDSSTCCGMSYLFPSKADGLGHSLIAPQACLR